MVQVQTKVTLRVFTFPPFSFSFNTVMAASQLGCCRSHVEETMKLIRLVLLACLVAHGLAQTPQNAIDIQGADTMILLGQRLTQLYQHKQTSAIIRVHGGGIQQALPRLRRGEVQIAQSQSERTEATRDLISLPVGVEGIVFYVHESNRLSELSVAQIRAIFVGEITNWKQLGGPDQRILLYGGESTTAIAPYLQEAVLQGAEPYLYWGKRSTKDLLDTIAQHPDGIGFASAGIAPHVKALRVRQNANSPAVEPTISNIRSRQYPVTRYVYWYLAKKPDGRLRDFCEWVFSSQGQLVVESVGFQPLEPADRLTALQRIGVNGIASTANR